MIMETQTADLAIIGAGKSAPLISLDSFTLYVHQELLQLTTIKN
jgi:hypothetical protein